MDISSITKRQPLNPDDVLYLNGEKCIINAIKGTGTSSIVYEATLDGRKIILKELYPYGLGIFRNKDNSLIIPKNKENDFQSYKDGLNKAYQTQLNFHNDHKVRNFTVEPQKLYKHNNTLYVVMHLANGTSYDLIEPENVLSILEVGKALSKVISYYHEKRYLNLDIKPENIFVFPETNQLIQLFDFNTVCTKEEASQGKFSYSEGYAAPEVRAAKKGSGKFSEVREQADIYSIGAVIFEKIMGRIPKASDQRAGKRWKLENNPYLKDAVPQLQKGIIDLFRKTLAIDKNDRYSSAKELISDLEKIIKFAGIEVFLKNQRISPCTPKDIYISRKDILSKISKALDEKHILYLHALGGSGKSETAREYAEQCTDKYDFIQSVFYSDSLKKTIANLDFVGLEDKDRFAYTDEDIDRLYKYKYGLLGNAALYGTNTLLIIDNYDYNVDPTSEEYQQNYKIIRELKKLNIHILFTTRVKPEDSTECLDFENMSEKELQALFFMINPKDKNDPDRIEQVKEIIEVSYKHTMTVKLVAMQSEKYLKPLSEYIDILKTSGLNSGIKGRVTNEKDDESVTMSTVYDHIKALFDFERLSNKQRYIMVNACLLPLSGLETAVFSKYIDLEHFDSSSDSDCLDESIEDLVNSGWIEYADTSEKRFTSETKITLHPLICDIVKNELKPELTENKCEKFYESFLNLIDEWGNRKAGEEDCIQQENMVYELFPNIYAIYENRNIPAVINFIALSDIKISVRNHIMISDGKIILYFGNEKQLKIPAGVTEIGDSAFSGCSLLTHITIPDSVTKIGQRAFAFCSALTDITIPDSVTKIGQRAFSHCSEITHITILNGVTEIGDYAFSFCYNLMDITIPDSITKVGNYAFLDCFNLTHIDLPAHVKKGTDIFKGCSLSDCQELSETDNNSQKLEYQSNKQLTELIIPDGITKIEDNAFEDFESLEKIIIPDSVTEIGNYAFRYCYALKQITIPYSVTKIGKNAFEACFHLTEIHIPRSVTEIKTGTFLNCLDLKDITIPKKKKKIRNSGFEGCCSLTHIIIPASVTEIESDAFSDCFSLKDIIIPDSVTKIRDYTFAGCRSLTHIIIPDSVTEIGSGAFEGCYALEQITIPNSVIEIGSGVFSGCCSLTQIIIPNRVTEIGEKAFADCNNLSCVVVMNPSLDLSKSMIDYCIDKNGLYKKKENLILKGYKNSTAEQYAQKHGFLFVSLD